MHQGRRSEAGNRRQQAGRAGGTKLLNFGEPKISKEGAALVWNIRPIRAPLLLCWLLAASLLVPWVEASPSGPEVQGPASSRVADQGPRSNRGRAHGAGSKPAGNGGLRLNPQQDRRPGSRKLSMKVVCWNGPGVDWGGAPFGGTRLRRRPTERALLAVGPEHNIFVSGDGCRSCLAGHSCSFFLRFASDVYFNDSMTSYREIMGTLTGPTLTHTTIIPHPSHRSTGGKAFLVSYQTWDAGVYRFTIDGDCTPRTGSQPGSNRLVSFRVEVNPPRQEKTLRLHRLVTPPRPCTLGLYGRWLRTKEDEEEKTSGGGTSGRVELGVRGRRRGTRGRSLLATGRYTQVGIPPPPNRPEYRFVAYPCTKRLQPLETFAGVMLEKGVKEISLVGDSHQRSLFTHLQTLIDGNFSGKFHGDRVWYIRDRETGKHLRMNFYWMEGTYWKGEYGCVRNEGGIERWPIYSNTSDIVIMDEGAWTFRFCENPVRAYSKHLPEFLDWIVDQPHKKTARFFWRTSPPFPNCAHGCTGFVGHRRSSLFAWANEFARSMVPGYGIEFLDFWPIEAARYADTCLREVEPGVWRKDSHYSCLYDHNRKVYGVVGEAVTRVFVHFLANL